MLFKFPRSASPGRGFSLKQGAEIVPVKRRAGVAFAAGGDVAVAADACRGDARVAGDDGAGEAGERLVLAQGVGLLVAAVKFNADAEIVAVFPPLVVGNAGVPSAVEGGNVLPDMAVAQDEEMGGDAQVRNAVEIGMVVAQCGQCAEE